LEFSWVYSNYDYTTIPWFYYTTLLATTANGKIVLDAPNGRVTVTFSALDTDITAQSYVYDFVFDTGSEINRLLEGQFIVTAGVTV